MGSAVSEHLSAFRRQIEPLIKDRYLDRREQRELMLKATDAGLSGDEAEWCIFSVCSDKEAVLESHAVERFSDLVKIAVGDRFLDATERSALEKRGVQLFQGSDHPAELTRKIISDVMVAEGAVAEETIRKNMAEQLRSRATRSRRLSPAEWGEIRDRNIEAVATNGVDLKENNIAEILDDCLENSELDLVTRERRALAVAVPGLLALIVAVAVFLGLSAILRFGAANSDPLGGNAAVDAAIPACDTDCDSALADLFSKLENAANDRRYVKPPDDNVVKWLGQLRAECQGYDALDPALKSSAVEAFPGWRWCEEEKAKAVKDQMVEDYLAWAEQQIGGKPACQWIERCLAAVPGNERCTTAARELGCE